MPPVQTHNVTDRQIESAQAIAAFSALYLYFNRELENKDWRIQRVVVSLQAAGSAGILRLSTQASIDFQRVQDTDQIAEFASAWRAFVVDENPRPRLEVIDDSAESRDAWELARLVGLPAVGAGSVYVLPRTKTPAIQWEWPLRLGVLGPHPRGDADISLARALENVWHKDLWRLVDMEQPGSECEILLLADDLLTSVERIEAAPYRYRADCILIMGGVPKRIDKIDAAMRRLLITARTGGIVVAEAMPDEILGAHFLTVLVRELSHDCNLDEAVSTSARELSIDTPWLLFSHELATRTSIALTAARLSVQLSPVKATVIQSPSTTRSRTPSPFPPTPRPEFYPPYRPPIDSLPRATVTGRNLTGRPKPAAAKAKRKARSAQDPTNIKLLRSRLSSIVSQAIWKYESGDARQLVQARAQLTNALDLEQRLAPIGISEPPQPTAAIDERQVHAQFTEPERENEVQRLVEHTQYNLRVYIDSPNGIGITSGQQFPTADLPHTGTGNELDVSLIPIPDTPSNTVLRLEKRSIHLPVTGASSAAEFTIHTSAAGKSLRYRLVVSHENRFLQSLLLDAKILTPAENLVASSITLEVENLVHNGFHNLSHVQPFDAAIIIDGGQNTASLTTLADTTTSIFAPSGLDVLLSSLKDTLTNETAIQTNGQSLGLDRLGELLFALMLHGRSVYTALEKQAGPDVLKAGRIQLIEAQPGAYFPLEFTYPLSVPRSQPPMCEHAEAALQGEVSHFDCPMRDDPGHMCPMRFWGFHKHIERQPAAKPNASASSLPPSLAGSLKLFDSVQVARSRKVQASDFNLPEGLLKVIKKSFKKTGTPTGWDAWLRGINKDSPGCLVLLAHTDQVANLPALEIDQELLPLASVETEYVKGPKATAPVLFLLSCSAKDPTMGFLSFVDRFKDCNASLVVGTLSTISAQRAARFLSVALPILKAAEGSGRTFGEVFLELKRKSLATGDGFALNLVAYGDMSWQL